MTSKIIEYDLKKPGRNYDAVYEIIKSYPVRTQFFALVDMAAFFETKESGI